MIPVDEYQPYGIYQSETGLAWMFLPSQHSFITGAEQIREGTTYTVFGLSFVGLADGSLRDDAGRQLNPSAVAQMIFVGIPVCPSEEGGSDVA